MINWGSPVALDSALPAITAFLWALCLVAGSLAALAITIFVLEVRLALRRPPQMLAQSELLGLGTSAATPPPARIWESHESTRDPLHDSPDVVGRDAAVA